ncbi:hypothetical protein [Burkholderia cenocepacia]|uniref:hypothetical protein n=1 Tax=Burkholderia cenocepacia TaxID=95486 RepID=UPI000761D9EB|nr:hypothetical protein [Burkholderia cenocepacia]KWU26309.1 hypothetical protein AS149_25295 [Burkholderia cenocepacia]
MSTPAEAKMVQAMLADPVFESALSGVAGAVAVSSETTQAVMGLPDAALGRVLKERISLFRTLKDTLFEPAQDASTSPKKGGIARRVPLPGASRNAKGGGRLDGAQLHADALAARQRMVETRALLDTATMVKDFGFVRQTLTKAVDTGRMFTVTVGSKPYYPAFYAHNEVDRKVLAKVTRALGDLPGWAKLDFFESVNAALGDVSPLEALGKGRTDEVLELAQAYGDEAQDRVGAAKRTARARAAA